MGPFQPVCFKDVHLMDPEAQSIFSQSIIQTEEETWKERGGPQAGLSSCRKPATQNGLQVFYLL